MTLRATGESLPGDVTRGDLWVSPSLFRARGQRTHRHHRGSEWWSARGLVCGICHPPVKRSFYAFLGGRSAVDALDPDWVDRLEAEVVASSSSSSPPAQWRMIAIGAGPGPKNVLVERDGERVVIPYAVWKHRQGPTPPKETTPPKRGRRGRREVAPGQLALG